MIFIPNNIPSLKNSKIATTIGKGSNKRLILLPSKTVKNYLKTMGIKKYSAKGVEEYVNRENLFRKAVGNYFDDCQQPVVVKFFFIRGSHHKFDFHNAVQIIADLLVAHGYIYDDNMDYFIPMPMKSEGAWYSFDKDAPGVWVKIVPEKLFKKSFVPEVCRFTPKRRQPVKKYFGVKTISEFLSE